MRGLDGEIRVRKRMTRDSVRPQIQGLRPEDLQTQVMGPDILAGPKQPMPNQIPQQLSTQRLPNTNMSDGRLFHITKSEAASLFNILTHPR